MIRFKYGYIFNLMQFSNGSKKTCYSISLMTEIMIVGKRVSFLMSILPFLGLNKLLYFLSYVSTSYKVALDTIIERYFKSYPTSNCIASIIYQLQSHNSLSAIANIMKKLKTYGMIALTRCQF